MASGDGPPPPLNPQSFKASEPTNKLMVPLPIVKEEGEDKKDTIIVDLGTKKRSVPLDVMPEKCKRPKSLTSIGGLPD